MVEDKLKKSNTPTFAASVTCPFREKHRL